MHLPSPAGGVLAAALLLLLLSSRALCNCSTPVLPTHSSLRGGGTLNTSYPHGTVLNLACITGYEVIPGTTTSITCQSNSTWSALPTLCRRVVTPTAPPPPVPAVTPVHPPNPPTPGADPPKDDGTEEEELPPYPEPSEAPDDEAEHWRTVAISLACVVAGLLLAIIIFAAVTLSTPVRKPEPPPAPPEGEVEHNVVSEGDMAFEQL